MKSGVVALVLMAASGAAATAQAPPRDLGALHFLLGDWETVGTPPGESGAFVFSLAVQDQAIVRTSYAKYEARDGHPASRHDDLMLIVVEDNRLRADYVDSEQHVIRYAVELRGPNEAVFVSDVKAASPRYRLSYSLGADGILTGQFEIAPPDAPAAFTTYLAWKARKHK
jgi:hypothetical protein